MGNKIQNPPNKSKNTYVNETKSFIYASSEMEGKSFTYDTGWLMGQEDAHIHVCDFVPDVSVFGVFDGHGSNVVARYVQKHFIEEL